MDTLPKCSANRCWGSLDRSGWLCARGTPLRGGMLQTLPLQSVCGFLCKPRCAALDPRAFCSFFFSFFNDKETLYYWGGKSEEQVGGNPPTQMPVCSHPQDTPLMFLVIFLFVSHMCLFYTHSSIQCGEFYILCKRVCFVNWDPKCARRSLPVCLPPLPCPWHLRHAICPGVCPRSSRCPSAQPVV